MSGQEIQLSVIVPVVTRYDDIRQLCISYREGLDALTMSYEIVFNLDGPNEEVLNQLREIQGDWQNLEIVQLARSFGEATALMAGVEASSGRLLLTLPAYFQVDHREFNKLFEEKGDDHMVIGHRWPRQGSAFEHFRRKLFHRTIERVTGQRFRDLGCSVRLFDREVLEDISLYGDQHRLLPVIAERNGFRVLEIDVAQSPLDQFHGSYSIRDYLGRMLDVFSVFFLVRFTKKPLRFFGAIGSLIFVVGAIAVTFLLFERIFNAQPLADRPALLLSSLLVVLGIQIFGLGLLGELIIFTHANTIKEYRIERIVNDE